MTESGDVPRAATATSLAAIQIPEPRSEILVAGLDGCRGGWVLVTTSATAPGSSSVIRIADLEPVIALLDSAKLAAAAIDIPIGLPESGPRRCDLEARGMIGKRRSSVFPAPPRGLLGVTTYEEAAARSRAIDGKGISRQAFAILPKIEEVDRLMTPGRQQQFAEVHPEVSFTVMAGAPMSHHKRTAQGRAERLAVLRGAFSDVDAHAAERIPNVNADDVLDAYVAAWSARRWLIRTHRQLGGELDERGLRMEMIA